MVGHACPGPLGEGSGFRSNGTSNRGIFRRGAYGDARVGAGSGSYIPMRGLERRVSVLRDDDVLRIPSLSRMV
jgi:hypothetical protein